MISDRRKWIVLRPSPGRVDYVGAPAPIAGGLAVLAVFCVHESRTAHPSLDVRLFRDPRLSSAVAAIALNFFAMADVYSFMSFYLQNVRGYSASGRGDG